MGNNTNILLSIIFITNLFSTAHSMDPLVKEKKAHFVLEDGHVVIKDGDGHIVKKDCLVIYDDYDYETYTPQYHRLPVLLLEEIKEQRRIKENETK